MLLEQVFRPQSKTTTATDDASNSSVDYLAIVLPTGKFGFGFGLIPYSSVGYQLQSRDEDDRLQYRYRGEGGVNKVFFGAGYQLNDNLKIGIDAQYNFGSIALIQKLLSATTDKVIYYNTKVVW